MSLVRWQGQCPCPSRLSGGRDSAHVPGQVAGTVPVSLSPGQAAVAGALPAAWLVKAALLSRRGSSVCELLPAPSGAHSCSLALLHGHGPVPAPASATCPCPPGHTPGTQLCPWRDLQSWVGGRGGLSRGKRSPKLVRVWKRQISVGGRCGREGRAGSGIRAWQLDLSWARMLQHTGMVLPAQRPHLICLHPSTAPGGSGECWGH